jgi:hypothetical protein
MSILFRLSFLFSKPSGLEMYLAGISAGSSQCMGLTTETGRDIPANPCSTLVNNN